MSSSHAHNLQELFLRHGPVVYRRARQILGNPADAEEAMQEVFIRAMRSPRGIPTDAEVLPWLYTITTNYCLNFLRDARRRRVLWEAEVVPAARAEQGEAAAPYGDLLLRRLLAEADEAQARAAVYVYIDGMSHDEAARMLGVSRRTVGNLLERFQRWARERIFGQEAAMQEALAGGRR